MVAILSRFGLAYFPIPKAANTSVKAALHALEFGFEPDLSDPAQQRALHARYKGAPMSPLARHKARGLWTFAVVRDPAERLISAYANRVVHHRDLVRSPTTVRLARLLRLSPEPDLEEFILNLGKYRLISDRIRRHTNPQWHYLGGDLGYFDRIVPIGRLDLLAAELGDRTGRPVRFGRHQTGGPRLTVAALGPRARDRLAALTRADYALLAPVLGRAEPAP